MSLSFIPPRVRSEKRFPTTIEFQGGKIEELELTAEEITQMISSRERRKIVRLASENGVSFDALDDKKVKAPAKKEEEKDDNSDDAEESEDEEEDLDNPDAPLDDDAPEDKDDESGSKGS